jgi:YD repeat-containing protein
MLNQYTSAGGNTLTYDANGNLVGGLLNTENGTLKTVAFAYDAQNRLTSATVNGTVTTFTHDPRNRVVQRVTDGTIANLTYDGWDLIEERNGTGALAQVYVHGAAVDELLAKITPTGAVYYHADAPDSTVALTDSTGSVVETYTYDAFGAAEVFKLSDLRIPGSAFSNRFLFSGRDGSKNFQAPRAVGGRVGGLEDPRHDDRPPGACGHHGRQVFQPDSADAEDRQPGSPRNFPDIPESDRHVVRLCRCGEQRTESDVVGAGSACPFPLRGLERLRKAVG